MFEQLSQLKRRFLGAAACAAAITALSVPQAGAGDQISVTHWGVLMYGAPYAVALEKGYFKEQGLDIDGFITSKGGGTTLRNALASKLPFGEVSLAAVVTAANQGVDLKIVSAGARTVAEILWVTMPDSPIKDIKDLVGKKIAFTSPKSVTDMLSIMSLEKAGIKLDSVTRIAAGGIGSGLTALEQGGVVAAPTMDPIWSKTYGKYRPVFWAKDLPQMTQTVGVTTTEFAKKHPEKVRGIIAARRKGAEFIYANPKEAGAIFAKHYKLDPVVAQRAIDNMVKERYWSLGNLEMASLDEMVNGLRILGEVKGKVDWSRLVDESFLPADLRNKK